MIAVDRMDLAAAEISKMKTQIVSWCSFRSIVFLCQHLVLSAVFSKRFSILHGFEFSISGE